MSDYAVEVASLSKIYNNVNALKNINLKVEKGEFIAIMGSSGSGKTTLLNILSCLDTPTSGDIKIAGRDVSSLSGGQIRDLRANHIGLVFQQFHLIEYLTVLDNIMLAQSYHSIQHKDSAFAMLEKLGLQDKANSLPSQLSGGQQQRVCIARALINDCSLLLADEPTGNLDAANEDIVLSLFKELNKEGKTILMVTHNFNLAKNAGRIINLQYGEIS